MTNSKCSLSAINDLLYRPDHEEGIGAILVITADAADAPKAERAIERGGGNILHAHHQLDPADAAGAEAAQEVTHEAARHATAAVYGIDGQRSDFRVAAADFRKRVAGNTPADFSHEEKSAAPGVEFQEIIARPRVHAETGAFDAQDAIELPPLEWDDANAG